MHRNGPKQRVLNNTVYTVCIQFVDSVVGRSAYKQKADYYFFCFLSDFSTSYLKLAVFGKTFKTMEMNQTNKFIFN